MTSDSEEYTPEAHGQFMDERKALIDAAREGSRTFDQAVLAFGSAVFGASVAFLKDVAPKPQSYSIPWLCVSWLCFTVGLAAVVLSFLSSQKACFFRIEEAEIQLRDTKAPPRKDVWGQCTQWCNWSCVGLLFAGIVCWIVFAIENISKTGGK